MVTRNIGRKIFSKKKKKNGGNKLKYNGNISDGFSSV